jgi:putative endonuclease
MKFYYTYVLHSLKDDNHYTGYTSNLKGRLKQHNDGEVRSTQYRRPLELVYFEACRSMNDALHREKYLKTAYGKRYLKNRMKNDK